MPKRIYTVSEMESFNNTRVFHVEWPVAEHSLEDNTTNVWVSEGDRPRCVDCQGLLSAMLSSCPHALAVRRYLRKQGVVV